METTRLTVRVSRDVLERAKRYARENRTTLSRLVSEYLCQLTTPNDPLADATIVRRLAGTVSQDVSVEDYREHLERRHGREAQGSDRPESCPRRVSARLGWFSEADVFGDLIPVLVGRIVTSALAGGGSRIVHAVVNNGN